MFEQIAFFLHLLTTDPVCVLPSPCAPESWSFPLLLVWWSLSLVLIALVAGIHLFRQTRQVRRVFQEITKKLQNIRVPGRSPTTSELGQVEDLLRNSPFTKEGWEEFQETVLREEKGENGEKAIFNTRAAVEFFPRSVVEQRISAFHRLMPVALTSLGLLGTFLALLVGLHSVRIDTEHTTPIVTESQMRPESAPQADLSTGENPSTAAPRQAVRGIDDLVNSLSGKFLSSIFALLLSVFYALWEARCLRQVENTHHQFCMAFDALFVRKTPESYLQKILEETEKQSTAFRHFNTDLSGYLKQSFQESLGPTLDRLTDALERLASTNEERMAQLIGSLSETFRSNLTKSAQTEFQQLAQALHQTAGLLQAMNLQSRSTQEGLETLLIRLSEMSQSTQSGAENLLTGIGQAVAQLQEAVTSVADTMKNAASGVVQQTGEASVQFRENIEQVIAQQSQQMRNTQVAYESLGQTTEGIRGLLKDSGEAFGQVRPLISDLVATTRDLRSVGEVARNAHGKLQQVTNSFAQQGQLLQQTITSHKAILDEFRKVFDCVSQGLGGILRQIGEEMQRYQERSRESLSLHLQEFDKHLASATQHIKVSVEGIGPGLEDLAEAIDAAAKRIGSNGGRR